MTETYPFKFPCALIADDQPDVLAALRLLLKVEGVETATATSPEAVIEAVAARDFDLVLMDMNYARDTTSGREGLELIERLRSMDRALPVVGMTAWGSLEVAVEAMRRGLDDFVLKPWENARLLKVLREQIEMGRARRREARAQAARERELATARDVQQGLIPRELPAIRNCEIAASWRPAHEVSGDYFDVLPFGEARAALCIGDVMGKGVSAGLLMSSLQALVKAFASDEISPNELCGRINTMLCRQDAAGKFVTFFYGLLDTDRGLLRYTNAGHNPPLLVRRDGSVVRLEQGGSVLGVFPDGVYEQGEVAFARGDRLLLFTDGITEASDASGKEFGEARLLDLARQHKSATAEALRKAVTRAVTEFAAGEFQDDATLMIVGSSF
jgi:sigma-B regulation protein RsbU (phosphoserine phosphatase)